jgi:hypothetical protein
MDRRTAILSAFWCLLYMGCCAAVAGETGNSQVIVFVYNQAQVSTPLLRDAETESSRVFRQASVEVSWVNCPASVGEEPGCAEPTTGPLFLRIVPRALRLTDSAFGAAFLDPDGVGRYADVFFESLARLPLKNSHVSRAQLLGDVMAHELGHLLLGTGGHSTVGIMQPKWSSQEVSAISMGKLLFTPDQGRLMRNRSLEVTRLTSSRFESSR